MDIFKQFATWACIQTVPECLRKFPCISEEETAELLREKWRAFRLARGMAEQDVCVQLVEGQSMPLDVQLDVRGYTARTNEALDAYLKAREPETIKPWLGHISPSAFEAGASKTRELIPEDLDQWAVLLLDDIVADPLCSAAVHSVKAAKDAAKDAMDVDIEVDFDALVDLDDDDLFDL